ncbi:substrate-binding periplasmic protein [Pseudomaricurvus hydrocarbonicus]
MSARAAHGATTESQEKGGLPVPIVIGVEDSWPPFADEQGQGISTDIVKAAFASVGQPIKLMVMPYARVLRETEAGVIAAGYNVTRQASTQQRFIFGKTPILRASASFYYSNATSLVDRSPEQEFIDSTTEQALTPGDSTSSDIPPKNYASAKEIPDGERVALILGYEYGDTYEAQHTRFREYRVARQKQIIRMLLAGRVDMAVLFDRVATHTMEELGLPENVLRRGAQNHVSEIYVAFSREHPESEKYAAMLDLGLENIKNSGVYDAIMSKPR